MATASMAKAKPRSALRSSRKPWLWLLLLAAALLAWFWKPITGYAITGASFGARVGCSCHFVGGRSISDCRKDFEPGMALIMLSADADDKSVTARFPLLASQTATFRDGPGCVLEPWQD